MNKRKSATFRLKPITLQKIKSLAELQNTSQGRIIDNLVKNQPTKKEKIK